MGRGVFTKKGNIDKRLSGKTIDRRTGDSWGWIIGLLILIAILKTMGK